MSKILANQIANYTDNLPIEVKEGLNIPAGKPLQVNGISGSNGQVLTSTGAALVWTTPFSGDYNSLSNKPTIPAAQVKSDWTAVGTIAEILNKPVIPAQPSVFITNPGQSTLTYNSQNGQFTYTPPNLSAYLTSYTEIDPIFAASPAATITNTNKTQWNTAYSWGNHATAGYLTSYTETDPIFNASPAKTITTQNKNNWDIAYGWGNHATQGYLKVYTETDPIFSASVAAGITLQKVSEWTAAYNWGNHATVGYLTNLSTSSIDGLSDVVITAPVNNQLLRYNGTNWVNFTPTYLTSTGSIDSHTDVTITSATDNQLLKYSSASQQWINFTPTYLTSTGSIDSHTDVTITSATNNQLLKYNSTSSQWENFTPNFLTSYTETDTLATVTARGASTTTACTFLNVTVQGNLTVLGTTIQNNVTTLNVTNSEIVINENQASGGLNATIKNDRGTDPDVSIRWNESSDRWQFTNDGSTYYNLPTSLNDLTNNSGYITSTGSIDSHTDVTITSPTSNQILLYNGTQWVNFTPTYLTSTGSIDSHTDVTISSPALDQILLYNGTQWVNTTPSYLTSIGSIDSHTDVSISSPTNNQVLRYNGSEWINADIALTSSAIVSVNPPPAPADGTLWWKKDEGSLKIYYADANSSQWVDASPIGDAFENNYPAIAFFPVANTNKGSFAYAEDTGSMYYSNGVAWTSQRLVTTNSSTTSDFATLLANTQLKYSVSTQNYTSGGTTSYNNARKIIRLSDTQGVTSDITLTAGNGLSIAQSNNNEITFTNEYAFTYDISSQPGAGSNATLRLGRSDGVNDNITFAGADGLIVENTDANTITFRAPNISSLLYTDEQAQDVAAQLFANGTHTGITFNYDDANNKISATVTATGGGGGGTTYDLVGSNTNSNNAIISLVDANSNTDSIEIAGGGGTSVNWDGANKKITVASTAPVQADWNSTTGLSQILNKPTIPTAYTLPTASDTVLGGIKVGANLSINPTTGVLDANPGSYTLPTASATVLGGIKIGAGLLIDGNGVVTASGTSSVPSIQDLAGTTASLAADASGELNITGYKAYSLFKITTSAEAWVRVYVDDASRDADATRSEGEDPTPGSGVISEVRTSGAQSVLITPGIMGFNNDNPRTTTIYLAVTNRTTAAASITVTLTALKIGE